MATITDGASAVDHRSDPPTPSHLQLTTTIPFVRKLLGLRATVSVLVPGHDHMRARTLIPARELRALYLKALLWLIDRECVNLHNASIVFVGGAVAEPVADDCPALSIHAARIIAEELPAELIDEPSEVQFDAYMFHGGDYFVSGPKELRSVITGVLFAVLLGISYGLYRFVLDVWAELTAAYY